MPTAVIVIFLLFFAVLAFAWFYLQRAMTRDAVATDTASSTVAPADPAPEASAPPPVDPAS